MAPAFDDDVVRGLVVVISRLGLTIESYEQRMTAAEDSQRAMAEQLQRLAAATSVDDSTPPTSKTAQRKSRSRTSAPPEPPEAT